MSDSDLKSICPSDSLLTCCTVWSLYCVECLLERHTAVYVLLHINHFFSFTRLIDYGFHIREIILSISNLTNIPPQKDCTNVEGERGKGYGHVTDEMRMLPVLFLGS